MRGGPGGPDAFLLEPPPGDFFLKTLSNLIVDTKPLAFNKDLEIIKLLLCLNCGGFLDMQEIGQDISINLWEDNLSGNN